ncbi:granzyme B(G,H)-like [Carassius gibelio]|uniref:granzyme B(G,H)-like n=1 Tax=Carassius gibelio TaxID=101364 RepID=UPI0022798242|nr:granzyme B(G,H)-like [Carassius gibelio]
MVVVGVLDLSKSNNLDRIKVKYCFQHQQSTTRPYRNDIMLLMLYEKINPNKHNIQWIRLPKEGDDGTANRVCSVMGWGRLKPNGNPSARLMEANAFIENRQKCEGIWKFEYIDSQMICVSGKGGSCEYDSGGPLVCGNIAVGITSFGDRDLCNANMKPNVYTKISAFLPWIKKTIKNVK